MNDGEPQISLVMPCYNEASSLHYSIPRLVSAFAAAGCRLQIVAVDNGSTDGTGSILDELASRHPVIRRLRIERNEGYGNGVLTGFTACEAPWVGIVHADGQVDAEDVVRLYQAAVAADRPVLAKVRRRFRLDGSIRKVVSVGYNLLVRLLWPGLGTIDVNGTPKILPRHIAEQMRLSSRGWFLDPEMLIKARAMQLSVLEFNVFARARSNGLSHVRAATCWEFFRNLVAYRLSPPRMHTVLSASGTTTALERAESAGDGRLARSGR